MGTHRRVQYLREFFLGFCAVRTLRLAQYFGTFFRFCALLPRPFEVPTFQVATLKVLGWVLAKFQTLPPHHRRPRARRLTRRQRYLPAPPLSGEVDRLAMML